jgi:hypothetical protein
MRVKILESALDDLRVGFAFYEAREAGVGEYFLDTLFGEIDSLALYGGIHRSRYGISSPAFRQVSLCDLLQGGRGHSCRQGRFGLSARSRLDTEEVEIAPNQSVHRTARRRQLPS